MPEEFLECPKCGAKIPLTKALTAPIEARLRAAIEGEVTKRAKELDDREESLKKQEEKLRKTVEERLKARIPKLQQELRREIGGEFESQVKDLKSDLGRMTDRAKEAEEHERELRANKAKLEAREKNLDLEVGRRVDEVSRVVEERVRTEFGEAERLKEQERALQIDGLNKQIEDLKQKLTQGSQQAQGEALELVIEDELKQAFPSDTIEPVPSGTRGADIVQKVFTPTGQPCGSIIWETKRTKDWNEGWIAKLREDAARLRGEAAILVSRTLPEGVKGFTLDRGVVVTDFGSAIPVAVLVRLRLLEVARQKRVGETSTDTREQLYQYLTSREFVSHVESIVLPLTAMKQDLDSEIRAIQGRWRKRQREIEKMERSIIGFYGDLRGIVGSAKLPEVAQLALPEAAESVDPDNGREDSDA
jgi:hypothetical protein